MLKKALAALQPCIHAFTILVLCCALFDWWGLLRPLWPTLIFQLLLVCFVATLLTRLIAVLPLSRPLCMAAQLCCNAAAALSLGLLLDMFRWPLAPSMLALLLALVAAAYFGSWLTLWLAYRQNQAAAAQINRILTERHDEPPRPT